MTSIADNAVKIQTTSESNPFLVWRIIPNEKLHC
jgi:hypothetical protein